MPDAHTTLEARIADLEHQVARLREQTAKAVHDSAAARIPGRNRTDTGPGSHGKRR